MVLEPAVSPMSAPPALHNWRPRAVVETGADDARNGSATSLMSPGPTKAHL